MRVTPRESLAHTGLIASLVGGIPLFGVLYWLSASQGSWRRVLAVHVVAVAVVAFGWIRHRGAFAEVTATRVIKQAFFRRHVIDRDRIASALIGHTWRPGSSEAVPQLLLRDADDRTLLRLRGTFWTLTSMESLVDAVRVPVTVDPETISLREFYEAHPDSAYWYEGRPWVSVLGIAVAFAGAFVIMSWIMFAIGVPSTLSLTP
ncbi:hypothetical protein [Antiquaquibacter soli]|uniref:PH domain-containing protein n=1 Tax=Antiquaquibacter soli TaxID=3064523 RepID=A0ABT9BMJ5_9MICO|nr:hypothetical protein [Protaetiibacter sp. WY-16]MDO7881006.1 hypothetical protein [Protaetiibacter sp. WY-16]